MFDRTPNPLEIRNITKFVLSGGYTIIIAELNIIYIEIKNEIIPFEHMKKEFQFMFCLIPIINILKENLKNEIDRELISILKTNDLVYTSIGFTKFYHKFIKDLTIGDDDKVMKLLKKKVFEVGICSNIIQMTLDSIIYDFLKEMMEFIKNDFIQTDPKLGRDDLGTLAVFLHKILQKIEYMSKKNWIKTQAR